MCNLKHGDTVYYGRNEITNYRMCICKVLNVNKEKGYFTCIEKIGKESGFTFLFDFTDIGKIVFTEISECVEYMEDMECRL